MLYINTITGNYSNELSEQKQYIELNKEEQYTELKIIDQKY